MKSKLPRDINLVVHIDPDGGFWVEFLQLPGCYTQGDVLSQLPSQVEDAVLTYFDVPREKARKLEGTFTLSAKGTLDLQPA